MQEFDTMDALSVSNQKNLIALTCLHPTREADSKDAAEHKAAKRKKKQEQELAEAEAAELEEEEAAAPESPLEDPQEVLSLISPEMIDIPSIRVDPSHSICHKDGVWWCRRCGYFATKRGRKLLGKCIGANDTGRANLRRIARGLTPHNSVR